MSDLQIRSLRLTVHSGSGQEHRIGSIASEAARAFAKLVAAHSDLPSGHHAFPSLHAAPLALDWNTLTDHDAAGLIAQAWYQALLAHVEGAR